MMKPKLEHYPKWLRELITDPFNCTTYRRPRSSLMDKEDCLKKVYTKYGTDPIASTLFDTAIDLIRVRFHMFNLQESFLAMIGEQASRITDQNERIEILEQRLAKLTQKTKKKKAK